MNIKVTIGSPASLILTCNDFISGIVLIIVRSCSNELCKNIEYLSKVLSDIISLSFKIVVFKINKKSLQRSHVVGFTQTKY